MLKSLTLQLALTQQDHSKGHFISPNKENTKFIQPMCAETTL